MVLTHLVDEIFPKASILVIVHYTLKYYALQI